MKKYSFIRTFTIGSLKGIEMVDTITFPSDYHFEKWIIEINKNKKLNYKVKKFFTNTQAPNEIKQYEF